MRFYTKQHQFYCGIDLHARTMYVCIIDHEGTILTHRNMPATAEALANVLQPYHEDLVVAVECIFSWYWVADLCNRIGVKFVLGHALYMKAIHGGKVKNDKIELQGHRDKIQQKNFLRKIQEKLGKMGFSAEVIE